MSNTPETDAAFPLSENWHYPDSDAYLAQRKVAAKLETERDALQRAYDTALRQMNEAIAKAEWLRTDAIVDLERDKARLDWLADPANSRGNVTLPAAIVNRNLHSLRAAIDETMANPLPSPSE